MRKISKIIVHCSDSDVKGHDDISIVRGWHVNERNFNDVGYHYFIKWNGTIQTGRALDIVGAHCYGQNKDSIGICLHGRKTFTEEQFCALRTLVKALNNKFSLSNADVYGHNHFDKKKTCPNFDVQEKIK